MKTNTDLKLLTLMAAISGLCAAPAFAGVEIDLSSDDDGEAGGSGVVLALTPVIDPTNDSDWIHLANGNIRTEPGAGVAHIPPWMLNPGNGHAEGRHSDQSPGRKPPEPIPPVVGHSDQWSPKGGDVPPIDWLPGGDPNPDIRVSEVPAPGTGVLLLLAGGAAARRRRR